MTPIRHSNFEARQWRSAHSKLETLVFSEFTRTNPGRPRPAVEKMVVSPVYAIAGGDGTALNCLYVLCVWNTYSSTNIDVHWHIMTATRILECVHDFIVLSNESTVNRKQLPANSKIRTWWYSAPTTERCGLQPIHVCLWGGKTHTQRAMNPVPYK